ncbi:MAG: NlpC/P60 family protein [Bosea sp. (in: a-proteobacteria)]
MSFDRRITPARPDLALESMRGKAEAVRFVAGVPARLSVPSAPLRRTPAHDGAIETEALMGEALSIIERKDGFAWVQLAADGYVGYLDENAVSQAAPAPTHRVNALRTFIYPAASMKLPPLAHLSLGAMLCVQREEGDFAEVALDGSTGLVWRAHLAQLGQWAANAVSIAESLIGAPYLWGGKTSLGLDCSGLVQLAHAQCGRGLPRDSDMQEAGVGQALAVTPELSGLMRGDLIFWKGHVGLMRDATTLLHANGHHMLVVSEPLAEAVARIAAKGGGPVTSIRRP